MTTIVVKPFQKPRPRDASALISRGHGTAKAWPATFSRATERISHPSRTRNPLEFVPLGQSNALTCRHSLLRGDATPRTMTLNPQRHSLRRSLPWYTHAHHTRVCASDSTAVLRRRNAGVKSRARQPAFSHHESHSC